MSVVGSQQQTALRLLRALRPHWRKDPALPARIQSLFARHKEFGSRDRRLYRELIYTALRYLPWVEPWLDRKPERGIRIIAWLAAETRDTTVFRRVTIGDWPSVTTLAERAEFLHENAASLLPPWIATECPALLAPGELETQLARAPLWLRLQTTSPGEIAADFDTRGWPHEPSSILPTAWRVLGDPDVTKSPAYARGEFEIQDLGSQLLLEAIGVTPAERWLDACAGAGGKTLQLAGKLGPHGSVDAHDIRPEALAELRIRANRARLSNVTTVGTPKASYDGVLVDAPCSGSGTWRRSPHLKWCTTHETIVARARLQGELLAKFAPHVRSGGRLVYATCSLARSENEAVISQFLAGHADFSPAPFTATFGFSPQTEGLTLLPSRHDTDGFFVASLRRR